MSEKLKNYFPILWDRLELLEEIRKRKDLTAIFRFFKELMNPEYTPERLNDFLSLLLKIKVKVRDVLPNDSTRITDESSLLITDIVVELENGSLANVEVQKLLIFINFQILISTTLNSNLILV